MNFPKIKIIKKYIYLFITKIIQKSSTKLNKLTNLYNLNPIYLAPISPILFYIMKNKSNLFKLKFKLTKLINLYNLNPNYLISISFNYFLF